MVAGELSPERWQRDLVQIQCELDEAVDVTVLRQCLGRLADRHDSLRAYLEWDSSGIGHQLSGAPLQAELEVLDVSATDEVRADAAEAAWRRPFDVTRPPRLRLLLMKLTPKRCRLLLTYQETELDEHAGKVLMTELLELYDQAVAGRPPSLGPAVSYQDYLAWLADHRDTEACHYWGTLLANAPAPTIPPLIGAGTCDDSLTCCLGQLSRQLSKESTAQLKQVVIAHEASLHTALLAAWSVLLAVHSKDSDVRFSAVFSLRTPDYANSETAVAMCFGVLPFVVRNAIDGSMENLLRRVRILELESRKHSAFLDGSAVTRRQLGQPGIQSLIFFDEVDVDDYIHRIHPEWTDRHFSLLGRNPYAIAMRGFGGEQLRVQAWYNPQSYSHAAVNCLLDQLMEVLDRMAKVPHEAVGTYHLLPRTQEILIRDWESGPLQPYAALPLHSMVEAQADRVPQAIAVIDQSRSVTYQQLSVESTAIARALVHAGLEQGGTVAICANRSVEMVVAVLGILKAGGAYLPLDRTWPASRMSSILRRTGTRYLVTDAAQASRVAGVANELVGRTTVLQLDGTSGTSPQGNTTWIGRDRFDYFTDPLPPEASPDDLAYIIFTSGSTGVPKGVAVRHRPVCNLIDWARRNYAFGPHDRVLWVTSLGFDLSVFDIFGILACGGTIRVASDEELESPERLVEILGKEPVTFWNSAPQALERLRHYWDRSGVCHSPDFSRLRLVFLSGDWIPLQLPDAIRQRFPTARVISLGGATEATVWSNFYPVAQVQPGWRSIPYGRPIQNARYYILNESGERCGIGTTGELFIGGDVLATGYAGDPDQTAERFTQDSHLDRPSAGRMYRTGDLARWWPDGNIELLGRMDTQVKVRGYRIELGEIEQALKSHPDVHDVVAAVQRSDTGENQLVAYLTGADGKDLSYGSLRAHLQQLLPEYMVPRSFVALPSLPLTANGKVDRKALARFQGAPAIRNRQFVNPRTETERQLAKVFSQVLGVAQVGATDYFFELGGDSLSALGIIFTCEQGGLHLTMEMLRKCPIEVLATEGSKIEPVHRPSSADGPQAVPLTPNQHWLLDRGLQNPAAYAFSVWLQSADAIDGDALSVAWQAVVDAHDSLRIRFHRDASGLAQTVAPAGQNAALDILDLRSTSSQNLHKLLESQALTVANSAQLGGSSLPRLVWTRMPTGGDLLFLFIPHIIVDEYSARIIVEDLGNAYAAAKTGHCIELPHGAMTFAQWATHLAASAGRPEIDDQVHAYCALPWEQYLPLQRDFTNGTNTYADARDLRVALPQADTERIDASARSLGLPVASIIAAAVVHAFTDWSCGKAALVDFTGAGREQLFGSPSLHRSVGYFSTIHPILIGRGGTAIDWSSIRSTHHALQSAPLAGARYELARYLRPQAAVRDPLSHLPQAEVKLNYHGRQPLCGLGNPFQQARLQVPYMLSPTDLRRYLLNLEIGYGDGCLVTNCKYAAAILRQQTVQAFLQDYLDQLRTVAASIGCALVAT